VSNIADIVPPQSLAATRIALRMIVGRIMRDRAALAKNGAVI